MNLSKDKNKFIPEDNSYNPCSSLSELNYNINQLFTYQSSQQLPRPIQEQNEIITPPQVNDDHDVISGEESSSEQPKKKHRGGPKRDPVWDYVDIGDHLGDGHYRASCRHCPVVWNRGRPQILKRHLARECANVPQQIKEIWRDSLAMEEKTIKRRNKIESRLSSSFNISNQLDSEIISEERQRQIDRAVLKGWICAGIPFETIDNPFIIDMFKSLNIGYKPPSRFTLSERILDEEIAKVEKSIDAELEDETNLTLSK